MWNGYLVQDRKPNICSVFWFATLTRDSRPANIRPRSWNIAEVRVHPQPAATPIVFAGPPVAAFAAPPHHVPFVWPDQRVFRGEFVPVIAVRAVFPGLAAPALPVTAANEFVSQ